MPSKHIVELETPNGGSMIAWLVVAFLAGWVIGLVAGIYGESLCLAATGDHD